MLKMLKINGLRQEAQKLKWRRTGHLAKTVERMKIKRILRMLTQGRNKVQLAVKQEMDERNKGNNWWNEIQSGVRR